MSDAMESLAARVEALEAIEAIRALKARYADLVDSRYDRSGAKAPAEIAPIADAIARLFAEDAVWDGGALGVCEGRDAIRARMAAPTLAFSRHYFVSPQITLDGDRATAHWELLAPCTSKDAAAMWMAGTEDDAYAKIGGVWLHTRMQLRVHFFSPHERGWGRART